MNNIVQSSLTLLGALFVSLVALGAADAAAQYVLLGGVNTTAEQTSAYLLVNAINTFFAALIGGYVAATVAESSPLAHAHVLGLLLAGVGVAALGFNGWAPEAGQPAWYALLLIAATPFMTTLGGIRVMRRKQKAPKRYSKRAAEADAARAEEADGVAKPEE